MIYTNPASGNDFATSRLMRQYAAMRAESIGLLAYEMGDFFEFYGDDAVIVSQVLDIGLTCRGDVPMCGFPVGLDGPRNSDSLVVALTSSQRFFLALVAAGYAVSVAMCDGIVNGMMQRRNIGTFFPPSADATKRHHLQKKQMT